MPVMSRHVMPMSSNDQIKKRTHVLHGVRRRVVQALQLPARRLRLVVRVQGDLEHHPRRLQDMLACHRRVVWGGVDG